MSTIANAPIAKPALWLGRVLSGLAIGSPLFGHMLFGLYLGLMLWGGLWLRDRSLRTLIPFRR